MTIWIYQLFRINRIKLCFSFSTFAIGFAMDVSQFVILIGFFWIELKLDGE